MSFYDGWAWTEFVTGEGWGATPGHDPAYYRLAERLGYGSDVTLYCLEHDLFHSFVEQELFHRESPILWNLAHDITHAPWTTVYEEAVVQMFQGFLRAGWDMTAVAPGVDWWAIREKARGLLGPDEQGRYAGDSLYAGCLSGKGGGRLVVQTDQDAEAQASGDGNEG